MRYEKVARLLELARELASNADGLTLDEMAARLGAGRRTAERVRDTLWQVFPQMEEIQEGRHKRFRIPGGLDGFMQQPSAEELAELDTAIRSLETGGGQARAGLLRSLAGKIRSAQRPSMRRRVEPDLEALSVAQGLTLQAGPRPLADSRVLALLRQALLESRYCRFRYHTGAGSARVRCVAPYGILYGKAYYLVGPETGREKPVLWRLDRLTELELGEAFAGPPASFNLEAFAQRSFGAYQEPPQEIVLRFSKDAAADAQRFQFHPSQTVSVLEDGSVLVRFTAGGLLELVRHLFTWGDAVRILAPESLRSLMVQELQRALAQHSAAEQDAAA